MKLIALAISVLAASLALSVAVAGAAEEPSTGETPAKIKADVQQFVGVKGLPTERSLAGFARFLFALPRAKSACERSAAARAGIADGLRTQAKAQIADVLFVEKGELVLYKDAREFANKGNRRRYVLKLDQVGDALDRQLDDAKNDRKFAGEIGEDCGRLDEADIAAREWEESTKEAKTELAALQLAYGV